MNTAINRILSDSRQYPALGLLFLLLFIWSIPGTIALRSLLLLILFIYVALHKKHIPITVSNNPTVRAVALGFGLYCLWAILHTLFLAQEPDWSTKELTGQLPRVWIAMVIGFGVGSLFYSQLFNILKSVFLFSLLVHLGDFILHWITTGKTFSEVGITGRLFGQKLLISYIANIYAAFVSAEIIVAASKKDFTLRQLSKFTFPFLFLIFITALIGARNGFIGLIFLVFSTIFIPLFFLKKANPKRLTIGLVVFVAIALTIGALSFHTDPRWERFAESVSAAMDGIKHKAWLDEQKYPLPILSDGLSADHSAYMRVARLRGAAEAIIEFPLGYGYGRNAYAHAWSSLTGEEVKGSSLSGLGDVGVALGFPGLGIWLIFCTLLILTTFKQARLSLSVEHVVLIFIVAGFLGRSLFDSNIRDHSLEMFLFLAGALSSATSFSSLPSFSSER